MACNQMNMNPCSFGKQFSRFSSKSLAESQTKNSPQESSLQAGIFKPKISDHILWREKKQSKTKEPSKASSLGNRYNREENATTGKAAEIKEHLNETEKYVASEGSNEVNGKISS
jgi:hypothetical protein